MVFVPDAFEDRSVHPLLGVLNSQVFINYLRLTTPYMGTGRQVSAVGRRSAISNPLADDGRSTSSVQPYRGPHTESSVRWRNRHIAEANRRTDQSTVRTARLKGEDQRAALGGGVMLELGSGRMYIRASVSRTDALYLAGDEAA